MKRTLVPTLVAVGLVAAACTAGSDGADVTDPDPSVPDTAEPSPDDSVPVTDPDDPDTDSDDPEVDPDDRGGPIGFAQASLRQFDECQAFLDYVHTEGAERVGPYGFGDNGWFGPTPFLDDVMVMETMEEEAPAEEAAAEPASEDAGASASTTNDAAASGEVFAGDDGDGTYSTTNVQVDGVDEPDIIKTDGTRILAVAGDVLHYVDIADDGTAGTKRGSVTLSNNGDGSDGNYYFAYGHEIFVNGDRAFVIAQGEGQYYGGPVPFETVDAEPLGVMTRQASDAIEPSPDEEPPPVTTVVTDAEIEFVEPDIEPVPFPEPLPGPQFFGPTTIVLEIDLSNPDDLRIVNTMNLDGRYISARSIGETGRIAVTSPPKDLGFLYPSNPNATEQATEANRELITNSTLEDWMPTYTLSSADGTSTTGNLVSCENIHAPSEFAGFDMLSIVTLDLGDSLTEPTGGAAIMATGDTVYASADRMYVTSNVWLPPTIDEQQRGLWEEEYETAIHRFSIAGDGPAQYEASGSVEGHLLNQFSMNDRDGTFYAATTTGTPWSSEGSVSQIVAMQVNGDRLEQVGQVGGLGEGERIFSVRYVDDVAYVVTFRQTDPFYIVDLADPTAMSVLGELKIPGYSSYLHPITDTLVLGVGQDATDEGRTTGTKVSLFDVSDPGDPREVDVWTMDNAGSDAEFDHRAFLYWAPTGQAVLPLTNWADQYSGAVVLNVGEDGLTEQGRVSHVIESDDENGVTDCQVFTGEGITEADGDLFWITQELGAGGSQLQFCEPGDIGGATGFSYCETIPVNEIENWFYLGDSGRTFSEATGVDLAGIDRIEWCWSDGIDWQKQIQRTLVIDGQLWSFSNSQLQANDLATLDTTNIVVL
jgi:Beta propeller domain